MYPSHVSYISVFAPLEKILLLILTNYLYPFYHTVSFTPYLPDLHPVPIGDTGLSGRKICKHLARAFLLGSVCKIYLF